jgi:hypothetical protein
MIPWVELQFFYLYIPNKIVTAKEIKKCKFMKFYYVLMYRPCQLKYWIRTKHIAITQTTASLFISHVIVINRFKCNRHIHLYYLDVCIISWMHIHLIIFSHRQWLWISHTGAVESFKFSCSTYVTLVLISAFFSHDAVPTTHPDY